MDIRPLDELEKLILRHLASGPHSASELADALRTSSQAHGIAITHAKITYRLGGLVSLKLVGIAERKLPAQRRDFLYSLRAEPKATTEAAPPGVEPPKAEPPKAKPPKGTQELPPKEDAPLAQASPKANKGESKSPSNARQDTPLTEAQLDARFELIKRRHRALLASGRIQGGHLR